MKHVLLGTLLAIALAFGLWGGVQWVSAQTATTAGVPVTLQGWIQNLNGDTLTLEGYGATTNIILTDTTLVGGKTGQEGRALLKEGKPVWVRGHLAADGRITAFIIRPVSRRQFPRYTVHGVVSAVGDSDLLVEMPQWEVQIVVSDTTRIVMPGHTNATLNDINVGTPIIALGRWHGHAFQARALIVTPPHQRPVTLSGFLVEKAEGRLVLETEKGEDTVTFTAETRIRLRDHPKATVDDLNVGTRLTVVGQWTGSHVLQARLITNVPPIRPHRQPHARPNRPGPRSRTEQPTPGRFPAPPPAPGQ